MLRTTKQLSQASQIVTLAEAKEHLRILHDEEDSYINTLIAVATAWGETDTDCIFGVSSWHDTFEGVNQCLHLAKQPVNQITSVVVDGVATDDYESVLSDVGYSTVRLTTPTIKKVVVTYSCGLPRASQQAVAKQLVLLLIGQLFNFREVEITGAIVSKVTGYEQLKNNLKVV